MSLRAAVRRAYDAVRDRSTVVKPERWQSMDVSKVAAAATHEVLNYTLQAQVASEDLDQLRSDVEPNLPWADDHFLERVGGSFNPGETWKTWPWANKADSFRQEDGGQFSHTYGERYWPRDAWRSWRDRPGDRVGVEDPYGIRYKYGDLADVVTHLARAPQSRQAYLPVWFPEDTGKLDVRVPCTLGYHFIQRHGFLHCTYYIRSCDLYRHFRDDVYLTVRLQLWVLDRLRELCGEEERKSFDWHAVQPGLFTMYIVSLHCFVNDYQKLFRRAP